MKKRETPYRGFLYAGLMIDAAGNPKVLEFNCRLGDPEAQALLFRLESDLVSLILEALLGRLDRAALVWSSGYSACVVLASRGYPEAYEKGKLIAGLPSETASAKVFHAGTIVKDGHYYTSGGRVLGVTAKGETLRAALDAAYRFLAPISWDGMNYRRDIGKRGLQRLM
jgi:phosphoribosylamine--glycine ligase